MVHVAKDIAVVNPTPWMPWVRVACPPAPVETAQVARPQVPLVQRPARGAARNTQPRGCWSASYTATCGLSVRLGLGPSLET